VKWYGWLKGFSKYVRGHNAVVDTCWHNPEFHKIAAEKRHEGYESGKYQVWNKGLTKETCQKVQNMSDKASETLHRRYDSGELISWQVGLTKETDERVRKSSETKKRHFSSGETAGETVAWAKGLTKETDPRIQKISDRLKLVARECSGRRLSFEEVVQRCESSNDKLVLVSLSEDYQNKYDLLKFRCKSCDQILTRSLVAIESGTRCFDCHPKESVDQLEIFEFIKTMCPDVELSCRTVIPPKEVDIWIPSKNVAVEFNGLYWHSEKCLRLTSYHDEKTKACLAQGVQLIHVFSDEWRNRREIIMSQIKNMLGFSNRGPGARSCELITLLSNDKSHFFDRTHLDGDTKSEIAFGLVYDGRVLSAMSLRRPFHKKWNDYLEIARFSSDLNVQIPGGLSRLTSKCLEYSLNKGYKGLMTYVDTRNGTGKGYERVGFTEDSVSGPRFWWTNGVQRFNRFKYRADPKRGLTQAQVAEEAKVYRIWGCSNRVMVICGK
jgi:hypothetical protein